MSTSAPRKLWIGLGVLALGAAAYFGWRKLGGIHRGPPSILLVTIDTLRADRLGCYGYAQAHTPNLDHFCEESVRFDNAISQIPLTLPSHATLLTGLYPARHRVRDNGGFFLDESVTTIAELARDKGYKTAGFVSAFVLDSKWGLDRGFDVYFDRFDLAQYERVSAGSVQRIASETIDALIPWLGEPRETPFFAWLHLYDPHTPYDPPEPFRSQLADRPYDGEIAYVDSELGRLFRFLSENGIDDSTVVIVTSDHGEGLGDHDELTHGNFVYDTTLRVPLMIRFPDGRHEGSAVEQQVGLVDLFSTLAEMMDVSISEDVQGRSLLSVLSRDDVEERALFSESFYPRFHFGWSEVLALRTNQFKYIDTPSPELYDLIEDPGELENIITGRAGTASELRDRLKAFEASHPETADAPREIDAETEARLRALGYVGTAPRSVEGDRSALADPKEKIHLIRAIAEADMLGAEGRALEAVALLEDVIAEDGAILDAHLSLGNKYSQLGRHDDAISAFRRCLEIDPDYVLAMTNLALSYRRSDRLQEAEVGFERVQELDPSNRQAFFNLGEIYLLEKRYEDALAQFESGLALEEDSPLFLRQSGIAHYYLHEATVAENRLREALRVDPELERAHFTLGLLYEQQGRLVDAEAAYLKERERHPDNLRASINLANLYGKSGRVDDQIRILEESLRREPEWAEGHIQLAKAYRDTKREELFEKVLEAADRGLALDPDSALAPLGHFLRAEMLDFLGRPEEARRAFERGRALAEKR